MTVPNSRHDIPHVPNHELIRTIGRGAYGEIWMARNEIGILRAIKVVERRTFEDEKAFQREFEGMARFEPISREHTGFVDILHVGRNEEEGFFYYVMELADDHARGREVDPADYVPKTLKTELKRRSRLLADEVISIGLDLTEALAALHRAGLVHRDIKPANIIFAGGRPKIADIGLVAASGQVSFVGTEGYVPPEGPGEASGDVFSVGKVLYELAMGKDRLDFPALDTHLSDLPDSELLLRLNDVLLRACANDVEERYKRSDQMHEDLLRVREGRPLSRLGRRRWPLVAAVLALTAAGAGGWYVKERRDARGAVTIVSEPEGAMVVVDGRMVRSPARFEKLRAGKHTAHIMLPGYDAVDREIGIEPHRHIELPAVRLERSTGAARLSSHPPGAEYDLLEGERVLQSGKLPMDLEDLHTGTYTLVARLDGRERRETLEVRRGEATPLEVEFAFGKLRVESDPAGVEVEIDGKPSGKTPLEISLADGEHEIVARYPRWPDARKTVKIEPANLLSERFEFHPGSVKISSAPGGAAVFADGREIGRTPMHMEAVEPGKVQYELRLAGYQPMKLDGEVKPGAQTFLGGRFTKPIGPQRGKPWENTIGMKFEPVGEVLVGTWLVRVRDFDAYCKASGHTHTVPDFQQDENHPVVRVSFEEAQDFCSWLSESERAAGKLADGQFYRLPSDKEWSAAAGLPDEGRNTPEERDGKVREYAWGKHWPPPAGSGNFADAALRKLGQPAIGGYQDGFATTSPVGSFAANRHGLFDMCGNVWQWTLEPYNPTSRWGVMRGGSWATAKQPELSLSYRNVVDPAGKEVIYGFRCVLVMPRE